MLKVAIIGAGQAAERHAAAYHDHPRAMLAAVADPEVERAASLAARYGARSYDAYEKLLASEELDAVSVCVPHDRHLELTRASVDAGVHILMEKPISTTLAEADEMLALVESAGLTMMIGFAHRFRTEVIEAKRLIESGAIGRPAMVLDKFCSLGGSHPPGWVWSRDRSGGGVLMYGGIHAIDRVLWLLDTAVESVFARRHSYTGYANDVEDGLAAILTLGSGATATLFENSPPYGRPGGWETELFGPEGAVRIRNGEWCELTANDRKLSIQSHDERHFHRQTDEFVSAILERREPAPSGSIGRSTLEVALAIYASAELGLPVSLPLPEQGVPASPVGPSIPAASGAPEAERRT